MLVRVRKTNVSCFDHVAFVIRNILFVIRVHVCILMVRVNTDTRFLECEEATCERAPRLQRYIFRSIVKLRLSSLHAGGSWMEP